MCDQFLSVEINECGNRAITKLSESRRIPSRDNKKEPRKDDKLSSLRGS